MLPEADNQDTNVAAPSGPTLRDDINAILAAAFVGASAAVVTAQLIVAVLT